MTNETPAVGHNNPPACEAFSMAITDLFDEAKNHLDGKPIENEAQADALTDILDGMKQLLRDAEKARKAEKEPHLQAGKAVDARWKEPKSKAELAIVEAAKPLTTWRLAVQAKKEAEEKRLREEVAAKVAKAQQARSEATNLDDAEKAEAMLKQADIAKKTANKVSRAPIGLRTYWEAEITDRRALLQHVMKSDPQWLEDRLTEYAEGQVRATHLDMPGVIAHERKRAA